MTNLYWKLLNLLVLTLLITQMAMDYFGKKTKDPIDNQTIDVIMNGQWKRFGDLNFNDKVWTTNQEEN